MKRLSKEKLKTLTIIILTIGIIISGTKLIQVSIEDKREFEFFTNEFYNQLQYTSNSVANVLSNTETNKELEDGLNELDKRLETTHSLLNTGRQYVDSDIWTIHIDGYLDFENETLTDKQVVGLKKLKDSLDFMINKLESDELNKEIKNINIEEFNEIINQGGLLLIKE